MTSQAERRGSSGLHWRESVGGFESVYRGQSMISYNANAHRPGWGWEPLSDEWEW
jgi:hypothetical protein